MFRGAPRLTYWFDWFGVGARTDTKVVYRRYASLFFVCGIGQMDNELITLEIVHRYVEVLDRYFGNVSISLPYPFLISSNVGVDVCMLVSGC